MHKPKGGPVVNKPAKASGVQLSVRRDFAAPGKAAEKPKEIGGPGGPEPTRYGDWERKGICYDF